MQALQRDGVTLILDSGEVVVLAPCPVCRRKIKLINEARHTAKVGLHLDDYGTLCNGMNRRAHIGKRPTPAEFIQLVEA
jgi:hypothetical protein